jgi:hypothetical protein
MRHMARHSSQLTLRDLDPRVLAEIHRIARSEGLSINKAAAKILKLGAGIQDAPEDRRIGKALDRFIGTLSTAEARALSRAIGPLEKVDDEMWE